MDAKRIDVEQLVGNFNQKKKARFRKFVIAFGAFIVPFVLITSLVLPIYDDRRGMDILLSYLGGDVEDTVEVGEEVFNNTGNLGWELLDDNKILHMWNQYNDYYFNVSNGIQFGNHYQEYWTQNVLMLGYYDGDEWNLIYRTDGLSGFNKDIIGETDDYINATIWKDMSYGSYDFRLAIRYNLGVIDSDLTIIPYIKNLGIEIPYVLGFGWEMKDIQINATPENDYININRTSYYLNQTLDNTYTNLSSSRFEICEDITNTTGKYLYLTWNKSLNYKVTVKSRDGQYNAPTTLFIRVGTLAVDQEKFTELHWLDAQTATYYFDNWDIFNEWATNPEMMVDNILTNFATSNQDRDAEGLISNTCDGTDLGTITKVEVRAYGKITVPGDDVILTPGGPGMFGTGVGWGSYWDITSIQGDGWTWQEVDQQTLLVDASIRSGPPQLVYCAKAEIRVTYIEAPTQSNPIIWNSTTGIEKSLSATGRDLYPTSFNITIDDDDGDAMYVNVSTNESGSWVIFNSSSNVGNGTYSYTNTSWVDTYNTKYWISFNLTDGVFWSNATYNFTTLPDWFKISSAELDSYCGSTNPGRTLENALDGTNFWYHEVDETHWFVLDLGQTYTIEKVRGRSSSPFDPIDINIYIDDSNPPTTLIEEGITTWQDTTSWVEIDITDSDGRYIKVEIEATEFILNWIWWGEDGEPWMTIFDAYGDVVSAENAAPTQTGESPTNHSTGIEVTPDLHVVCNDADGGDTLTATMHSNSSGPWVHFATNTSISPGTNITQSNPNFTAYNTKYWWSVNLTDGTDWKNVTYDFTTGTDTVTITLLSYSPANIRTNSSEPAWFIYNITTGGTPINFWSIVWAYGVNHTEISSHNTSYSLEDPLAVDKLRGYSRNENNTQETKFNSTAGDGSIGDFGEWNTHDMNGGMITVDASGSNWTRVNSTEEETEHLFAHITFVDEEEIREEQKSGQEIDVTGADFVKVEFNMTDTDWWDSSHYNNTLYKFHFYANETDANKPLSVYYVNNSYTTGDVASSPYAAFIGAIQPGDPYHISEDNSSYYEIVFSSTEAGFIGAVNMTEKFYIIFTGQGATPKRWWIHYADNNDSHVVDGDTHYHDFDNRTIIEVSNNGGNSWIANASTPDVYLDFISLNEEDKVEVKLYANDTSGNEAWSSTHQDLVDITNYPPNHPSVVLPNDEPPTDLYEVGEIINITYNWIGDPNHETCWVNITAHEGETEVVAYYLQNRSITDAETHVNATWYYDWDTTGISTGTYHINITATDPFNEQAWGEQNGTFDLIAWQDVNTTINGSFTNVSIRIWQNVNDTINGLFTNVTIWEVVDDTYNGAFTNATSWQNVDTAYNGEFTNITTWKNVNTSINGEFTNASIKAWQVVNDTVNGEFTNVSIRIWQVVNDTINGVFTNTTLWYNVDTSINGAFTNTTTWQNVDTTYNGAFTNTTVWYNVDVSINGEFTNASIKTWQVVNDTINGIFTNTTTWQDVDTTYNGAFTNTTSWKDVDTAYDGIFTNATTWQDVDTSLNGEFTNVSIRTWQNVNDTINGIFTNATTWKVVNDTINGAFINGSVWQNVDTSINGAFTNTTTWQNVDTTYNGEFTNTSIRTWQVVNNTVNGAFTNTTNWQNVNTSINGAFTNATTWQDVDTTINGAFTNTTSWRIVDNTYNGEFTNVSIRTWQVVNDTINGAFTNVSIRIWQNVDVSINGEFTNTTTWQNVNTSINGVFTNTTIWYNVDITYNGAFTNTTTWHNVDISINGVFTNVSIRVWQNVNDTINGAFTNTTLWYNVDTIYNGVFTNVTTWRNVDVSINGEFTNISIGITWQDVDTTINGVFTNVTVHNITITNEYPANGSDNIPVNTSIHFTVNHTLGYLMNITVYTGSNMTNVSALLGSFNSVSNDTYYLGYHNASKVSTEYAWRVNVTDAYGNYADETYNFTTASTIGIFLIGVGRYTMGMLIVFSAMFVMMGLSITYVWKKKKEKINRR